MNRETSSRSPSPPTIREAIDTYQGSSKSEFRSGAGAEGVFYSPASSIAGDDQIGSEGCPLAESFTPGDDDVICGRGKKCYSHVGNDRFRLRVLQMLDDYSKAKSKLDKSSVLSRVVDQVRQQSPSGGFVKQDTTTGRWFEVGDFLAREKTSQAFRDALHDRYKSSNLSKKKRRQEEQAKASDTFNRIARTEFEMASRIERLSQEFLGQDLMGMDYYGQDDSMGFDAASQPSSYNFSPQLVRPVAGRSFSNRSPEMNHQFFRTQNQQSQNFLATNAAVNRNLMPNSPEEYACLLQEIRTNQFRRQVQRQPTQAFPDPLFGSGFNEPNVMPDSMSMSAVARRPPIRQNINNNNNYQQVYRTISQQQAQDKVTNKMARLAEVQRMHRSLNEMPDMSADANKMARMAEVQRMHHSLTEMPDMSGDPFMDRDKFRRLCNSLPNISSESYTMPSYDVSMQDQSQPIPYADYQEKIMIDLNTSMHQNIMSLDDRKQSAVDFDPIPFEDMKGLQKKRASSDIVTKKPVPYDTNSAPFGAQTMPGHRISKDLLDNLGKNTDHTISDTDHTISDDTLYEPIPMSQHTQRQIKQFPTDMENDSFEFGDEV